MCFTGFNINYVLNMTYTTDKPDKMHSILYI